MIVTTLPIPGTEEKCEDFKPYTSQSEVDAFLKSCAEELRELVQDTWRKISEAGTGKEDISGLYGRYDVTLRLELEQFWRIYPWICAHKFGVPFLQKDIPEQGASIEEGDGKCDIKVAKELLTIGERRVGLYPELDVYVRDIETSDWKV